MKRYLKPICIALVLLALLTSFAACGKEEAKTAQTLEESETVELQKTEEKKEETEETDVISIKPSPDKYTWYVKNYVGKNCASFGYTSLGEDRFDEYGEGLLKLIFITPDGSYVDYSTNKNLKEWVVTGQSLEPNTELKLTFERDSEGNEYSNLVDRQNYDEILLSVKKVGSSGTTFFFYKNQSLS